jgi:hypothetical protein
MNDAFAVGTSWADGERSSAIRMIVTRSRQFLPKIEADLALVKELVQAYERTKAK